MYLIHKKKSSGGTWEVAWTWLPYFLSIDKELHQHVGNRMTEEFKGQIINDLDTGQTDRMLVRMHCKVVDLIIEKYPIEGLRDYLLGISHVNPESYEVLHGL